jgi:hypothetical protein
MKKWIFLMITFGLILFIVIPASAFSTYTSHYDDMDTTRNAWLSDLGISAPDTTIDFESGFTHDQDILGTTLSGGLTITSTSGGYAFVTNSSGDLGGSYPLGTFALAVDENDNYTFAFSASISYFGFYMMDNSTTPLTINYTDGSSEDTTIGPGGSGGYNGRFLAMIFDKPVSSLYIPRVNGGDGEVGIDNIEFGNAVPIPGALWLLGSGLLGLVAVRRKRK